MPGTAPASCSPLVLCESASSLHSCYLVLCFPSYHLEFAFSPTEQNPSVAWVAAVFIKTIISVETTPETSWPSPSS